MCHWLCKPLRWLYFYFEQNKFTGNFPEFEGGGTLPQDQAFILGFEWMGQGRGRWLVSVYLPSGPRRTGFLIKFMDSSAWKEGAGYAIA